MKRIILMLVVIAALSFTVTSCKKDKKEEAKTEVKEEAKEEAKEVLASNDVLYQCPMDCEKGKSYTEAGKCPVCKMDLKEKKVDLKEEGEHKEENGHGHEKTEGDKGNDE